MFRDFFHIFFIVYSVTLFFFLDVSDLFLLFFLVFCCLIYCIVFIIIIIFYVGNSEHSIHHSTLVLFEYVVVVVPIFYIVTVQAYPDTICLKKATKPHYFTCVISEIQSSNVFRMYKYTPRHHMLRKDSKSTIFDSSILAML